MPSTRRARRERAHRQGRARAGAAPQRDVGRPSPALRGDGGVAAAIRRRAGCCGGGGGCGRAAAGRCGTAGGSAAELGDGTQLHGARFGPHSLLCSHRALCSSGAAVFSSCSPPAPTPHLAPLLFTRYGKPMTGETTTFFPRHSSSLPIFSDCLSVCLPACLPACLALYLALSLSLCVCVRARVQRARLLVLVFVCVCACVRARVCVRARESLPPSLPPHVSLARALSFSVSLSFPLSLCVCV